MNAESVVAFTQLVPAQPTGVVSVRNVERLLRSAAAATLGRTLLHSLWEGATIALLLAIVLWLVRSPRFRYAVACGATIALLAGMIVTFVRLFPQEPAHLHLTGFGNHAALAPWDGSLSPLSHDEWKPTDELAWLAPFWVAGVLIFHLRGLASWMAARRLRNKGVCRAANLWQERLALLASRLKLARPVVVLESCFAEVPVVIGYLRPVILAPVGLITGLPAGQVEAILLHELAHIRRFDYLVNLLQVFCGRAVVLSPGSVVDLRRDSRRTGELLRRSGGCGDGQSA